MLVGIAFSAIVPFIFGHFELRAGRKANSPALIAEARDYQLHLFSSGMVFVALIGQNLGFRLDRVVALAIVALSARTAWNVLYEGMRVLLDASLDRETLDQVRDIIEAEPSVAEVVWVTGRNAGRFRFIEAAIELRVHDLEKAHAVSHHIEGRIREVVPYVDRVLIHAEPPERTHLRCAVPLADLQGTISEHLGEAPYFALVRVRLSDGHIEEHQTLGNPFIDDPKARGIAVAEWLVGKKVDFVLLRQSLQGRGPTYVFRDAGVEMELTQAETLLEGLQVLT
jgi:predicted Fe-Mo cluster-binding NifX family protein